MFFPLFFFCDFLGAPCIFLGQAWAEGEGELATCASAEVLGAIASHSLTTRAPRATVETAPPCYLTALIAHPIPQLYCSCAAAQSCKI